MPMTSKQGRPQPNAAERIEQAIQQGDWIQAAMADIHIGEATVRFNGSFYSYRVDAVGALVRLDPSIKKGALAFGLHEGKVERFYGQVCKVLGRELRRRRRRASAAQVADATIAAE